MGQPTFLYTAIVRSQLVLVSEAVRSVVEF